MKVEILYQDSEYTVGKVEFDYEELLDKAYDIVENYEIAKAFADTILDIADNPRYNYGAFEVTKNGVCFTQITPQMIQYLPLLEHLMPTELQVDEDLLQLYFYDFSLQINDIIEVAVRNTINQDKVKE